MKKNNAYILSFLAMAFAILEKPFSLLFGVKGGYIIAIGFMLMVIMSNINDVRLKRVLKSPPVVIWIIWIFYSLANWYLGPKYNLDMSDPLYVVRRQLLPIGMMIIVSFEGMRNTKRTIWAMITILITYVMIGLLFQQSMSQIDDREDTMLGNEVALTACVLGFYSFIASARSMIKDYFLISILVIVMVGVFYLSTRKALGGIAIIAFFYLIGRYDIRKPRYIFALVLLGILAFWSFGYIMENTMMGERLATVSEAAYLQGASENDILLRVVGDRAGSYLLGWSIFLQNPITGIGLTNYPSYTMTGIPLHTEYMAELCENGIIGSLLYVCFNISIIMMIFKSKLSCYRTVKYTCLGGMACIMFISLTAWTYAFPRYFSMFGIIIAICYPQMLELKCNSRIIKNESHNSRGLLPSR